MYLSETVAVLIISRNAENRPSAEPILSSGLIVYCQQQMLLCIEAVTR